jgi:hypothetical protein
MTAKRKSSPTRINKMTRNQARARNEAAREFLAAQAEALRNGKQEPPPADYLDAEIEADRRRKQTEAEKIDADTKRLIAQTPQPQIASSATHVLVHARLKIRCTFERVAPASLESDVHVTRTAGKEVHHYLVPAPEARYLWARLLKQGYERF